MKRISAMVVTVVLALGMLAAPAAASTPDTDCLRAGQAVLREAGLFTAAARGKVDYSALVGDSGIRAPLPPGSFLPLATVFELHLRQPELFAWCD